MTKKPQSLSIVKSKAMAISFIVTNLKASVMEEPVMYQLGLRWLVDRQECGTADMWDRKKNKSANYQQGQTDRKVYDLVYLVYVDFKAQIASAYL